LVGRLGEGVGFAAWEGCLACVCGEWSVFGKR
jgi:hypothetical protein